jgi:dTDP-N-acetylfucosamine:lipid II N-acetylfucosaminyltransferase
MSDGIVLHLFGWDKKFFLPFRNFIHEHFAGDRHEFIIYGDVREDDVPASPDTTVMPSIFKNIVAMTLAMNKADKIIIHGLFNNHLFYLLAIQSWVLKKCCWVIWGGDLYIHNAPVKDWRWKKNEILRRYIIKRFSLITTTVPRDYLLAKEWYGFRCKFIQNLMYRSHLARFFLAQKKNDTDEVKIQIGNSADPSNNHKEIIDKLAEKSNQKFSVVAPLSYGNHSYRDEIVKYGKLKLGCKFNALTEFMSSSEYDIYLSSIDIAIFNHNRQQAMGNIIALLSLGKKVLIRSDITPWPYFYDLGIKVYDSNEDLDIEPISEAVHRANVKKCAEYFTESALVSSWQRVFKETSAQ